MIPRTLAPYCQKLFSQYPVLTITGPRQSGKSTLVKQLFAELPYVNLEFPDVYNQIAEDPRGFLDAHQNGVVIDEIQRLPSLLSYIQGVVDEIGKNQLFVLTGSHQLSMHRAITQSLTGRTALLTLLPFSIAELSSANINLKTHEYLLNGFYPRIYDRNIAPTRLYQDYVRTYIERDVRQLLNVKDLSTFQTFLQLCAGRIGQVLNMQSLSNEVGVSANTIKDWLSILEASYIIVRLQPYFENIGKRVIKSPKLFFTDVGLAAYLLGIENATQLNRDPLKGHLFENMVVMDMIKSRYNQGLEHNLYFFRDSHQNEVDVIFKQGHELYPIEIKSSQTYHSEYLKGVKYFQEIVGERAPKGYLLYAGEQEFKVKLNGVLNYQSLEHIFMNET